MAKLVQYSLKFAPSTSPDVVGYKFYLKESPDQIDYDSPFVYKEKVDGENPIVMELNELLSNKNIDGIYNVGVTAVDTVGNESDMSIGVDYPLDFVAPDAPGSLELIIS